MKDDTLPELERLVLLGIIHAGEGAYGVSVMREIRERTGRRVLRPAIYDVLRRLEGKGFVRAQLGDPLPTRGGRARTHYTVTEAGLAALRAARSAWMNMWEGAEGIVEKT